MKFLDRYGRWENSERRLLGWCCFKGGGGCTTLNNTQTKSPSDYEIQLHKAQANYALAIAPNRLWLK